MTTPPLLRRQGTSDEDTISQMSAPVQMAPPQPVDPHEAMTAPLGPLPTPPPPMGMSGKPKEESAKPPKMSGEEKAPAKMSPQDEIEQGMMGRYRKNEYAQQHPWGTPENHPGFLGKLGHVASKIGNIAGDIFAPGTMALIPGTEMHRNVEQAGLRSGIEGIEKEKSQEELQGAQAKNQEAEAQQRLNPQEKIGTTPEALAVNELIGKTNPATGKPYSYTEALQKIKEVEQGVKPEPKVQPAHITYDAGIPVSVTSGDKVYDINDPALPPELKPLVDSANRAHGQHLHEQEQSEGRKEAQQMRMMNARENELSGSTKTMTEAAPRVLTLTNKIDRLVDQQMNSLGPASSRWQEFMAGKVGAPNPEFTRLRTDVGLLTTLLMRMHVGARGGEYIMKHFQDLIDSGKQSPANLKAALQEIREYAQDVQSEHGGFKPNTENAAPQGAEPPRPANVPAGYKFNAHGPKGAGWYK